jgi:flagellar protein FliS
MAINHALESYKKNDNDYIEGINSPHGRVSILFDTILSSVDSMVEKHPKTDFINLGKSLNGISILANSLNHKDGGEIADNLVELYDYCRRSLSDYVQDKDIKKLDEVYSIITKLSDGWKAIDPKTKV